MVSTFFLHERETEGWKREVWSREKEGRSREKEGQSREKEGQSRKKGGRSREKEGQSREKEGCGPKRKSWSIPSLTLCLYPCWSLALLSQSKADKAALLKHANQPGMDSVKYSRTSVIRTRWDRRVFG